MSRDNNLALLEVCVQALIFLLALISNGVVILALMRQLRLRPKSRMFRLMLHLSIADLLVALLNVLPQIVWDISHRFEGPDVLCRLMKLGQVFPLYLSSFMLTTMAVDRASSISSTKCFRPSLRACVLFDYILAFFCSIPQLYIFGIRQLDEQGTIDCWAYFGANDHLEKLYLIWFLAIVFFLPLLLIALCYCLVTIRVWQFDNKHEFGQINNENCNEQEFSNRCSENDTSVYQMRVLSNDQLEMRRLSTYSGRSSRHMGNRLSLQPSLNNYTLPSLSTPMNNVGEVLLSRAKRKSLELTATVCICFAVCWLPWSVAMLFITFGFKGAQVPSLLVILALLASLNSTTNPWIYLYFNKSVLHQVKCILGLRPSENRGRRRQLRQHGLRQLQHGQLQQQLQQDCRPNCTARPSILVIDDDNNGRA